MPTHLPKYSYEISLKNENGEPIHIILLALSEPLKICGPNKTIFPRCLVNDKSQKLVLFSSKSQTPLEYHVTAIGYENIT